MRHPISGKSAELLFPTIAAFGQHQAVGGLDVPANGSKLLGLPHSMIIREVDRASFQIHRWLKALAGESDGTVRV